MRVAAIGDLHCRVNSEGKIRPLLEGVAGAADVLLLAGDLTDGGLPAEVDVLERELADLGLPVMAVLGNHDHHGDNAELVHDRLVAAGVHMLDGSVQEIEGVAFVGTKGFCGGFGKTLIQPFGENALKTFIQTSLDEVVRLENALAKVNCPSSVVLLHYAPIRETLEGEPLELYPFLGSSRLGNALDRHEVNVAVHGHAHHGAPSGRTRGGVPVHNVSRFVREHHNLSPCCVFDV